MNPKRKAIHLMGMMLLTCITYSVSAQRPPAFRLNSYFSYVFEDQVDSYYSNTNYFDGKVAGGFQWGLGLEYMFSPNQGVELTYLRMDTKAPTNYWSNGPKTSEFDLDFNYIMLGTTRYWQPNPKIEPYFGAQAGVGIMNASNTTNGNDNSATKFAWGIKGGMNYWAGEKVGLKLNLGLVSVSQAVGGGLYFGTGGVGTGVSSYSSVLQFGIGAGIVARLGGK